ncbi:thioesterase family protein [Flavobacterium polysaccharolyticum]|uniref:Thioesterase family protein n=1 Tax=Flavobacterium polysaccharolyticum TaxID=3133148 RepID=A0ABU9NTI4_9FLAO
MFGKNYVVTGDDVNDFMVMENDAYFSYTLRLLYVFLFNNGFSKEKLNALHLGFKEGNHRLTCYKNLMFTQPFYIEMNHCYIDDKIMIKSRFFNLKKECCAEVTKEVEWFDYARREVIPTPRKIMKHFNQNAVR